MANHAASDFPACLCESCFRVRVIVELEALRDDVRIIRDRDAVPQSIADAIGKVGENVDDNFLTPEK